MTQTFAVIIPTMQRAAELDAIVAKCSSHYLVSEILIINNVSEPLHFDSPKVKVLPQEQNIGVNPAWNLGVRESTAELLAILNDDIDFDTEVFTYGKHLLSRGWGLVGPASTCLNKKSSRPIRHRIASGTGVPFGRLMMLRRTSYRPIPDDLIIWGGDDWLFLMQDRPSAALINTPLVTKMSSTSGATEFTQRQMDELLILHDRLKETGHHPLWHRGIWPLRRLRRGRGHVGALLAKMQGACR